MDLKKTPHVYYSSCHYGSLLCQTFSKKWLFSGLCGIGNVVFICEILALYKYTYPTLAFMGYNFVALDDYHHNNTIFLSFSGVF